MKEEENINPFDEDGVGMAQKPRKQDFRRKETADQERLSTLTGKSSRYFSNWSDRLQPMYTETIQETFKVLS